MRIHELISQWNHSIVKALVSTFGPTDQQNRLSTRVKCVECPEGFSVNLGSKLLHVFVAGFLDSIGIWPPKGRSQNL
jgi:hypothetical protein